MKTQIKLSSLIFIIIIITSFIAIVSSYIISKRMIEDEIYHRLESTATSKVNHIEMLLNNGIEKVKTFAIDKVFVDVFTTQNLTPATQRIKTLINIHDDISRIRILDKQGNIVVSSHSSIDYAGNTEVFTYGKKKVYIRDMHISTITGTKVISISVPMLIEGKLSGIMIANIEVEKELYKILLQRSETTDEVYLINKNRYMITPSRFLKDTFLKQKVDSLEAKNCFVTPEFNKDIYKDYRGELVIGVHHVIKNVNWCLLLEIDEAEAFEPVYKFVKLIIIFFIVLLIIGGVLGTILQKKNKALRKILAKNQRQNWFKTGQTELNKVMRGDLDIVTLTNKIITHIAKYLQVQIGTLYLYNEKNQILQLEASYAFNHGKSLNNVFKLGDGLIGQAALEQEIISIVNVPENYAHIISGTGHAIPHNIIIVPIVYNHTLKGVIELGSLQPFPADIQQFLATITENIAISIISAQSRIKMSQLLTQSQRQTEELATQQEELRATNEELYAQQEELKAVHEELEEYTQALENNENELKNKQIELEEKNIILQKQSEELQLSEISLRQQKNDLQIANEQLERNRREIETKASKLEVSSRYKSEFLANMSHELRTPLNSMLVLSQLLSENNEGNFTNEQIEFIKTIHNSGHDLLNLIDEILDLSKIEAGKMIITFQTVQLVYLANILKVNFKPIADQKNLALHINFAKDIPKNIVTDDQKLAQIIKNLLSNSFKFTKDGSVTLNFQMADKKANLSNCGLKPQHAIAIAVTDTGIGIPQNKKIEIFKAFQQADGSTSRQYGGTGLGLSISKKLAKLLGGELQLSNSIENEGSTFILYLPLSAQRTIE
ncbi:ATP-binding protein [Candidatus Halobeggiatoa sp. HSG11]|nr:ATP-binding protein [Candidatus Halobeggiatoa sp. HSG11]